MHVGFLCNCKMQTDPAKRLSNSLLNRALLVDESLRPSGARLFLYSPRWIVPDAPTVPGYVIENRRFVAATCAVPRVNGNWTSRSHRQIDKGMGYRAFLEWTRDRGIGIYVPYEFSDLVSNKHKTYKAVRSFSETLHPHTQKFRGRVKQVRQFLERGHVVFFKPRHGNQGRGILVLRPDGRRFTLTHYRDSRREDQSIASLSAAVETIEAIAGNTPYIVQEGIDTARFRGSAFDLRVITLHDGQSWHSIFEARIGAPGNEISNVGQGGFILPPEEVLADVVGSDRARPAIAEVRRVAHELAAHLDTSFPGQLIEIAFDFLLDASGDVRLAEINTKPGLAGLGYYRTVLDMRPQDVASFERDVYPHTRCLARFLRSKLEGLEREAA